MPIGFSSAGLHGALWPRIKFLVANELGTQECSPFLRDVEKSQPSLH
jgi:hypothetical protein